MTLAVGAIVFVFGIAWLGTCIDVALNEHTRLWRLFVAFFIGGLMVGAGGALVGYAIQ